MILQIIAVVALLGLPIFMIFEVFADMCYKTRLAIIYKVLSIICLFAFAIIIAVMIIKYAGGMTQ